MAQQAGLNEFVAISSYVDPVDIKKLRFIYSAIEQYAHRRNKAPCDIRVLEIGCGIGGITVPVASLGCRVRALDIDEDDISELRAALERHNLANVDVTVEDAFALADEQPFDIVIASEVFEHVLEPDRLAAVLKKQMLPGAHFILTTPNGYGPYELKNSLAPTHVLRRWNWLRSALGKSPYERGEGRDHCQRFTRGRLQAIFRRLSMKLIRFDKSDSIVAMSRSLRSNRALGTFDTRLADALPYWMASGWYMVFELSNEE